MAYELYQSRHKGYEIDNLLDDVVDLNSDVAALKTEYDANKVKMSDGTILPLHLVNTYATKTDLAAKADSTQVAADIATATTDMATNTGVASAIATATTDMATNTGVASAISTATTDMATNASVASDIATATTDMATNASVASAIAAAAYVLPEATTSTLGGVKVDGTTITADADGTIHGASAIAKLDDIGDVNAPSPSNGQVLGYDSTTNKWVPTNSGGGGGGGGHTIIDSDGSSMTARTGLQFGSDLETSDDSTNNRTVVSPHELTNVEVAEILSDLPINPTSNYVPNTGFTPVGTVISVMGNEAPTHYLKCDGTIYLIAQYPVLAKYFEDQFGSSDYFGGDGLETFAVPDLQGEFLRGTGTNGHPSSGDGANVGEHQAATGINPGWVNNQVGGFSLPVAPSSDYSALICDSGDKYVNTGTRKSIASSTDLKEVANTSANGGYWTIRPTNTSVLYCIATKDIYIDAKYNYSTDEKVIGTWINGKPLYQKTVECGKLPNKTTKTIAHNVSNIDLIVSVSGFSNKDPSGTYTGTTAFMLPLIYTDGAASANNISVYVNRTNILIRGDTADWSANWVSSYVTIQYTKTSD